MIRSSKAGAAHKTNGHPVRWSFRSADDVKQFWKKFQRVPARKRRTKRDEERYCLGLYLLALATHRRLKYPLRVEEGERPDFILTWNTGKSIGLEVIKASEMWSEFEAVNGNGKPDWFASVRGAIAGQLSKVSEARRDLLVYDDRPLPFADRVRSLTELREWLDSAKAANPLLRKVSMITSLDVALDTGNEFQDLPFVNWSKPGSMPDFGERVNFTGKKAVVTAVRAHENSGRPVYSTDSRGRIVKWMPDGTRCQVQLKPSGAEGVIGEPIGK